LQLQTCCEHHHPFSICSWTGFNGHLFTEKMWALCLYPILICTYEAHLASLEYKDLQNLWQKSGFISTFETHFARKLVLGPQNLQLLLLDQKDSN
jgi:hypothetical protein